jgi:hypothetical protein
VIKARKPQPPRHTVLVFVHADGFIEVFGDKSIDAKIVNVPDCPGHEAMAEDVAELMMPARYRNLYRADRLIATGVSRKFRPTALRAARQTAVDIAKLNGLKPKGGR